MTQLCRVCIVIDVSFVGMRDGNWLVLQPFLKFSVCRIGGVLPSLVLREDPPPPRRPVGRGRVAGHPTPLFHS